jgi:lipoprotein signal peptidase
MSTKCLNCEHSFKGNFCPNCGQKATVKRLSAAALFADTIHFFTHLEKGFFFTTRSFILQPGSASLNYISGKRKKYQPPVSYFLIWTGLYILLHDIIVNYFQYQLSGEVITQLDKTGQANIMLQKHFTLFIIPAVFCSALSLYYILAKPKYNFTETITLCLFGGGTYFMMLFFSDLILGVIFKVNVLTTPVFLSFLYNSWLAFDIFRRAKLHLFWLRLILSVSIVAISGWVILFYFPIAWNYFTKH